MTSGVLHRVKHVLQQGRTPLQIVALAVVAAFWALYLARIWNELSSYTWQWSIGPILVALATWSIYTLGQGLGWLMISRAIGLGLETRLGVYIWTVSMPARYIPGNVWHVLSRVYLGSRAGMASAPILMASTIEQGLMIIGPMMVLLLSLAFWIERLDSRFLVLVLLVPIGLVCLHPRILQPLMRLALRVLRKPLVPLSLEYRRMLVIAVWYSGLHLLSGVAGWLIVISLTPLPVSDLPVVIGAYSLAYVVGYLSFLTPTGLGVREAAILGFFSLIVAAPVAAVAALLCRAISSLGEALCVLCVGYLSRPTRTTIDYPTQSV